MVDLIVGRKKRDIPYGNCLKKSTFASAVYWDAGSVKVGEMSSREGCQLNLGSNRKSLKHR